jgi:hypothetical protein
MNTFLRVFFLIDFITEEVEKKMGGEMIKDALPDFGKTYF